MVLIAAMAVSFGTQGEKIQDFPIPAANHAI
jgi:hypothetical protein